MEHRLAFTISAYIYILFASAGFVEAYVSCNRSKFDVAVTNTCIPTYEKSMASTNYLNACPWPSTRKDYITLNNCVEAAVTSSGCVEPSIKDQLFLEIHRTYFSLCSYWQNPDSQTLLLLVLPCIIAALLLPFTCVYLTTCTAFSSASPGL